MYIKHVKFLTIFLAVLFTCRIAGVSQNVPDDLQLISIDKLFPKKSNLTEEQKEQLRELLNLIKKRLYVEAKKMCEMEEKLLVSLEGIRSYGSDAAFGIPVITWLFVRDDRTTDIARELIFGMGDKAVPHLKSVLGSRNYIKDIKVISLLYELDTKNRKKYFKELISRCRSVNARERLTAVLSLQKTVKRQERLFSICIDLLKDDNDETVSAASMFLLKHIEGSKPVLKRSIGLKYPLQSARIIRILWRFSSIKERKNLNDWLLQNLRSSAGKDRNIIIEIMVELGLDEFPGKTDRLFGVFKAGDFLDSRWQVYVQAADNDVALASLLDKEDDYAPLHAAFILTQRGYYFEKFPGIFRRRLKSANIQLVDRTLYILEHILAGNIPVRACFGESVRITVHNFNNWDELLAEIQGNPDNLSTRIITERLSYEDINRIKSIPDTDEFTDLTVTAVVAVFNVIKDNLNFYFENTPYIMIDERSAAKVIFDSLVSDKVFIPSGPGVWKLKEGCTDYEKEKIKWFNIAILNRIYPVSFLKRPPVEMILRIRYQSLIEPLADLLDRKEKTAMKAGRLLQVWGNKSVDALKSRCKSANRTLAIRANGILLYFGNMVDIKPHFDYIRKSLKDPSYPIREIAVDFLVLSIAPPELNIPTLIEALALEGPNSMRVPACLYFADKKAIPYLEEAIYHENPKVAIKAMGVLARNSGSPDEYVPVLAKAFKTGSYQVKLAAAKALEDIGPPAVPAAKSLIPGLGGGIEMSHKTKLALRYIGKGITPDLIKYGITSKDEKTALVSHALLAHFGVDREKHMQAVIKPLRVKNHPLKSAALAELADLRSVAGGAIDILYKIADNQRGRDKETILWVLSEIAPDRKETFELLIKSLKSPEVRIREIACYGLGVLGPRARDAVPKLEDLIKNDVRSVRVLAEQALKWIKGK